MRLLGRIDSSIFVATDSILRAAVALAESLRADTGVRSFFGSAEMQRAIGHLSDFYVAGLVPDSVRFDRIVDHVAASAEYVRGTIPRARGYFFPSRTPHLAWVYYGGRGLYFNPVTTVQNLLPFLAAPKVPMDTLSQLGNALWHYAVWHTGGGQRFPRWEYEFVWETGGIWLLPPWESAMAQGSVMALFVELYRRSGDGIWRSRAQDVFRSFQVSWDEGGALLADTSHGYWWEEYHPRVMVWNGSVKALLTVGYYAQTMQDASALRMYRRGIDALKYFTPRYDTGSWTLYSLTQGLNTVAYHTYCVQLLDSLYAQNGDQWFKGTADRWRKYTPPSGVR